MRIKEITPIYLRHLKTLGRSYYTIRVSKYNLMAFLRFLETEQAFHIEDITGDLLEEYQQDLAFRLTAKGTLLSLRSQSKHLEVVRGFTRFLKEKDYLVYDPGERIKLPKQPKKLPKAILSAGEIKNLMAAPDMRTNRGYRNRIIRFLIYCKFYI